ncbi:unnamed protein product, partial [Symbiodinium necroappetens]
PPSLPASYRQRRCVRRGSGGSFVAPGVHQPLHRLKARCRDDLGQAVSLGSRGAARVGG